MERPDFEALDIRLRAMEDRFAILNLISSSAISADLASRSYWGDLFAEDAVLGRGSEGDAMQGREKLGDIMHSPGHVAGMESGMAHFCGLPHIQIEGDRAVAAGYFQIVVPNTVGPEIELSNYGPSSGHMIWRLTANRWEFVRTANGWKITRREIRRFPGAEARDILREAIGAGE